MHPSNSPPTSSPPIWKRIPKWGYLIVVVLLALLVWQSNSGGDSDGEIVTFETRRGPLDISVIEGGSVEALESQRIRSEIRGYQGTKILRIVEEGYQVKEEDVRTNKVLVELDSSELKQRLMTQESELESRFAMLTEGNQAYEIQLVQNQTDIKAAQQTVKFALMDLQKFMGENAAADLIGELGLVAPEPPSLDDLPTFESAANAPTPGSASPGGRAQIVMNIPGGQSLPSAGNPSKVIVASSFEEIPPIDLAPIEAETDPEPAPEDPLQREAASLVPESYNVDFSKYADTNRLGDGSALQDLRKKQDEYLVAKKELMLAKTKLEGTRKLREKEFITKTELENEEVNVEKMGLAVDTSMTALALYKKYEFPKLAEETVSKYEEALQALAKTYKEAISKLAQARAKKMSAQNRFEMGKKEVKEIREQIDKCTITAEKTGLVVYGGGNSQMIYYGGQEQIREGATVRERQAIITIPDMTKMSVQLKIHESHIKKISKGLKTRITFDAFPDEELTGEVSKVGVLPDSQNRYMSPDLKVYLTTVTIDGTYDWVKPGMSAKVEILVNRLDDSISVRGPSPAHHSVGGQESLVAPVAFAADRFGNRVWGLLGDCDAGDWRGGQPRGAGANSKSGEPEHHPEIGQAAGGTEGLQSAAEFCAAIRSEILRRQTDQGDHAGCFSNRAGTNHAGVRLEHLASAGLRDSRHRPVVSRDAKSTTLGGPFFWRARDGGSHCSDRFKHDGG